MVQTITHLLNIPQQATSHTEGLRATRQGRHAEGVRTARAALAKEGSQGWIEVMGDNVQGGDETVHIREAVQIARGRRELECDGGGSQHFKPDLVLMHTDRRSVVIVDVTFASDDALQLEDKVMTELQAAWRRHRRRHGEIEWWEGTWVESDGQLSGDGIQALSEDTRRRVQGKTNWTSKTARYQRRYKRLREVIHGSIGEDGRTRVLILAAGVGGSLPEYTREGIRFLSTNEKGRQSLRKALITTAQIWAIRTYREWQKEEASHG